MGPGRLVISSNRNGIIAVCPASDPYKMQPGFFRSGRRGRLDPAPHCQPPCQVNTKKSTNVIIVMLMDTDNFPEEERHQVLPCAKSVTSFRSVLPTLKTFRGILGTFRERHGGVVFACLGDVAS